MERYDDERAEELIDFGSASTETRGGQFVILDSEKGRDLAGGGISDD